MFAQSPASPLLPDLVPGNSLVVRDSLRPSRFVQFSRAETFPLPLEVGKIRCLAIGKS